MNKRPLGRVIKLIPRDQANDNAMKQTCECMIVLDINQISPLKNLAKTLKYFFFLIDWYSPNKMASALTF